MIYHKLSIYYVYLNI